jgi:predicted P-loop ATPase
MNDKLTIATGLSVKSLAWKNKKTPWINFVNRLKTPVVTSETYKEYLQATKDEQLKIKDVGGYVGGYLRNSRRKPENVVNRQLLTLDLDFAPINFWDSFCLLFDCAAVLHSTHKHSEETPRFRLLIPLAREVNQEEYVAIARKIAGDLNIDYFDNTTFQPYRLMFWPSISKDSKYYFKQQSGPWVQPDEVLSTYIDWTDASLWPTADKRLSDIKNTALKQEDPETKKGVIGAFCRTYSIEKAIETFLVDEYVHVQGDRYTYLKGTTSGGLIIYNGKFAYSHHGTDPISGKLCNAFDLVRIHKFGHLDSGRATEITKTKSYKAMEDFVREDAETKQLIAKETIGQAQYVFNEEIEEEENLEWAKDLKIDGKGKYLSIAPNINLIIKNDPKLKGGFKYNEFDNKRYIFRSLPWRNGITDPEIVRNVDYSGIRNYIESIYDIVGNLKIDDSLALEFERHSYHPIKNYLSGLKWDGVERVDTLLVEYFGALDNIYTREAIRKMLVGAVARIFNPGCKFDYVLTLVSEEGTGKSTFVKKLGKQWFSDTFLTVTGKEAYEQIQGAWLIEIAELAGLRKAEIESVKHFITKQEDCFRPAYGRVSETYKRQCVFFGTTNDRSFLKEPSGNRRFLPIDVNPEEVKKDLFSKEFDDSINQIWAEAVQLYRDGEHLFLSVEANKIANVERRSHVETDERAGLVEDYLEKLLPKDWKTKTIDERALFFQMGETLEKGDRRDYICVVEIWCECLSKDRKDMTRYNTREINNIMKGLQGWQYKTTTKIFGPYGKQKYYARKDREL